MYVWRSEDNLQESILSLCCGDRGGGNSGGQGWQRFNCISHLTGAQSLPGNVTTRQPAVCCFLSLLTTCKVFWCSVWVLLGSTHPLSLLGSSLLPTPHTTAALLFLTSGCMLHFPCPPPPRMPGLISM